MRVLAITVLAGPLVVGMAAEASAEPYTGGGTIAGYVVPTVRCEFKTFGTSTSLVSKAAGPAVYAPNYRAGANNDAAWVRYRLFLVNQVTGGTTASTGWSGYAYATDIAPTTWSGSSTLSHSASGNAHRVVYQIEWYHSSKLTGWVADRATKYNYYDRYNRGPFTATSC